MSLNQKDLEQGLAAYKKSRKRELLRMMLLSALGIAAFLVIWQLVVQFKLVNVRNLPAPSKVVVTRWAPISWPACRWRSAALFWPWLSAFP